MMCDAALCDTLCGHTVALVLPRPQCDHRVSQSEQPKDDAGTDPEDEEATRARAERLPTTSAATTGAAAGEQHQSNSVGVDWSRSVVD